MNEHGQSNDVFVGGYEMGYHTMRIPSIINSRSGTIIAYAEARRSAARDFGDIDLVTRRSTDSGATWGDMNVVHTEEGDVTIGNPCPIVDHTTGRIVLIFTRNNERAFVTSSDSDGERYSSPVEISSAFEAFRDEFAYVRIATGPCHGLQMSGGRMVVPVWLSDQPFGRVVQSKYRAGVIYSDDRGVSWRAGRVVPPVFDRASEGSVCELSDGRLLLNLRIAYEGYRGVTVSDDGGHTWSAPELDTDLPDPSCQGSIISISAGSESHSGELVLFSNLATGGPHTRESTPPRRNLTIRLSRDGGKSWFSSRVIFAGPSGYSDIAFDGDTTVCVLYENGDENYRERISCFRIGIDELNASKLSSPIS